MSNRSLSEATQRELLAETLGEALQLRDEVAALNKSLIRNQSVQPSTKAYLVSFAIGFLGFCFGFVVCWWFTYDPSSVHQEALGEYVISKFESLDEKTLKKIEEAVFQ